jgi:hypothetical protein
MVLDAERIKSAPTNFHSVQRPASKIRSWPATAVAYRADDVHDALA